MSYGFFLAIATSELFLYIAFLCHSVAILEIKLNKTFVKQELNLIPLVVIYVEITMSTFQHYRKGCYELIA